MAQYKDLIPIRRSFAAVALAILLVTGLWTGGFFIAMATVGVYLLFYVAFEPAIPLANFGKRGDFSYGLYLYGWPIQQLLLLYVPTITPMGIFWCALPLTLVAAILSWHFIEEPCLRRKKVPSVPPAGDRGHVEASIAEAPPVQDAQPEARREVRPDSDEMDGTPVGQRFSAEGTQ
jgi:peptidoglycan/LPS O-acetylase OafA/YrhL